MDSGLFIIRLEDNDLGEDVPLCHDGENEGILTIGELAGLIRVLPGVVFLK